MFIVGLTGGIGSGKSAATDYFQELGIDIVDADLVARTVVQPSTPALEQITQHFGSKILQENGELDRAALRQRIFSSPDEKQWLEDLLHPLIRETIEQELLAATSPYVILSAPLLVEGGLYKRCNRTLIIDVPETLQIERTHLRDNNTDEQIQRIIQSQASREQRLQAADDVIDNSGALSDLKQQVSTLHKQYLEYARQESTNY